MAVGPIPTVHMSPVVPTTQAEEIDRMLLTERTTGRSSRSDIVRACLSLGLPLLWQMAPADRHRLYAALREGRAT